MHFLLHWYSLGQVENARRHLCFRGQQPDQSEMQKLSSLELHLKRCADARKMGDWKALLRESAAAMESGADYCPQVKLFKNIYLIMILFGMKFKIL